MDDLKRSIGGYIFAGVSDRFSHARENNFGFNGSGRTRNGGCGLCRITKTGLSLAGPEPESH